MGYLLVKIAVAVALVLIMNGPQTVVAGRNSAGDISMKLGKDPNLPQKAYDSAVDLARESKSLLDYILNQTLYPAASPITYCVDVFQQVNKQTNLAVQKLKDLSGGKQAADGAVTALQNTASTAWKCYDFLKEDNFGRRRIVNPEVKKRTELFVQKFCMTYDLDVKLFQN
ncbi:hypothetical protein SUGI_0246450 [Cryptomeria japonica]|nr:hypothetical protein SUGI_0246450 [Cryptomeria japonica]